MKETSNVTFRPPRVPTLHGKMTTHRYTYTCKNKLKMLTKALWFHHNKERDKVGDRSFAEEARQLGENKRVQYYGLVGWTIKAPNARYREVSRGSVKKGPKGHANSWLACVECKATPLTDRCHLSPHSTKCPGKEIKEEVGLGLWKTVISSAVILYIHVCLLLLYYHGVSYWAICSHDMVSGVEGIQ